jgi:hypothetical protein
LRLLFLISLSISSYIIAIGQGQDAETIKGKIVDTQSGAPIPFATVRLRKDKEVYGVISNGNGDFRIPLKYKASFDTLVISCIGYVTNKLRINQLSDSEINTIRLQGSALQLPEVVIKGKADGKLTALKIVKAAIATIPLNYPTHANSYLAYYRDYQMQENQYTNLNEAIVEIFDEGFNANDQLTTGVTLYDYKKNNVFPRDSTTEIAYDNDYGNKFIPGAILFPFGGNELSILRIHDAIRNSKTFSYSYVNEFAKDFTNNHFFKLLEAVYLNNIPLYHISFRSRPAASGSGHFAKGDIYIEHGNYAIHRFEYSTYEGEKATAKMLYNIQVEYSRLDSLMRLNYISFNNFFKLRDPLDFKVVDILLNRSINAFIVTFNNKPEQQSAMNKQNYDFSFDDKKLVIERIEIPARRGTQVYLYLGQNLAPGDSPLKIGQRVKAEFNGIKDIRGKEVNKITYIPVNQFREIFVQKQSSHVNRFGDSLYIHKNEPLSQNRVRHDPDNDISNYWMNTPLKGKDKQDE